MLTDDSLRFQTGAAGARYSRSGRFVSKPHLTLQRPDSEHVPKFVPRYGISVTSIKPETSWPTFLFGRISIWGNPKLGLHVDYI
jgi:hypothetical protein